MRFNRFNVRYVDFSKDSLPACNLEHGYKTVLNASQTVLNRLSDRFLHYAVVHRQKHIYILPIIIKLWVFKNLRSKV